MTDQNITTTLTSETVPTFVQILERCGLTPEQWRALDEPRKEEWLRVWFAEHPEAAQ